MDIYTISNIFLLVILLALTAFFVASEFAVVKIRTSRIDQLIAEGNKKAVVAKKVVMDLDYYLSACQLGITVTALGLGAFSKPFVKELLNPVFDWLSVSDGVASIISYAISLSVVTYLHVVIGEMAPKTLAIEFSEKATLLLAGPLYWFGKIMYPFIQVLNGTSRVFLRMFGVPAAAHEQAYSEEELKIIMAQSFRGGEIDQTELKYMENVFSFDERVAKDIMVPRTDLVTIDKEMSYDEIIKILDEHNYTRYPVIENGDKDRIIGIVNAKKMLSHIVAGRESKLEEFIRDVPHVVEVTSIQDSFLKMQQAQVHMTVVMDEYGGTSGIITLEDVLEEIVGEIRDEFDADEVPDIRKASENKYIINGRVLLSELEDRFGLEFEDSEDLDTIAGWIQLKNFDIAQKGDEIKHGRHLWTVDQVDNFQIKQVIFHQDKEQEITEEKEASLSLTETSWR
ncbi:hemolysin family protein [Aquibacillus koreensis]|uniref:Hemolysin family protein n=1 Tax=Aquibacillus koreensis TaxID=279446 RepID=A0A9X3WGJ4_9BACI|nr:hemolysin family protein [Aquibacillus koreensis]MCT2536836.1 hemolysin family protein [Aquibacillus koreensis]MDC3419345.1 hemolysin family protein [Aquibacillus koreensis]